jgi:hypothetical protein
MIRDGTFANQDPIDWSCLEAGGNAKTGESAGIASTKPVPAGQTPTGGSKVNPFF